MKHNVDDIVHVDQAHYVESLVSKRDAVLAKMEALALDRHEPISDPEVAAFLTVATRSMGAKRALEVGTNIGYGAITMARAGAHVVTIEKSHELVELARGFAKEAELGSYIDVREGAAIDVLASLTETFDLAYVDCVKEEYPRYLELLAPRIRTGGVVIADNVLWRGLVATRGEVPDKERERVEALRRFNVAITSPPWSGVILPLGDGVAYAVRGS
jgi:predicted O-methyltransferase YrrM